MLVALGAPASAPQNHFELRDHEGEFSYVQRRVRKTSVDERRVSSSPTCLCIALLLLLLPQRQDGGGGVSFEYS